MWALLFGVGTGLILAIAGWATYALAPRVGPNPLFGVRTGYSMVSREVWDQSNRAGGVALVVAGALVALAGVLVGAFGPSDAEIAFVVVTGALIALLLMAVTWMVLYSRWLAKGVQPVSSRPIRVSMRWAIPAGALAIGLSAFLLATASQLPAENVATHFGFDGTPNDWMSRAGYTALSVALVLGLFAIHTGILYLVSRISIPGADEWPVTGESAVGLFVGIMIAMQVVLALVFFDVYWFNTRNEHFLPMALLVAIPLLLTFVAVPAGILYIIRQGKRT
ncbi:MAG: SdpI family protein [Chloroflexi bacterium]|nr:SdpI family protein [Chloroflexota bacterium]